MRLHCFGNSHLWTLIGGSPCANMRLELNVDEFELIGWKLGASGATAYALLDHDTASGAGDRIPALLDLEDGDKDVLMVFGEVDVTEHIGRHGGSVDDEVRIAVDRYAAYCRAILDRDDVGMVLVASTIPHSHGFRPATHANLKTISEKWNAELQRSCLTAGLTYVDWYDCADAAFGGALDGEVDDRGEYMPSDPEERHMAESMRPTLVSSIRAALLRLDV